MACVTTNLVARPKPLRTPTDLIFINISDPVEASIPDVQKLVRSHATHNHHSRDRDPDWKPSRKSQIYRPRSISAWAIDQDALEFEPEVISQTQQSASQSPTELTIVRERPEERFRKPRQNVGALVKHRAARSEDAGRRNSMVAVATGGSLASASSPISGSNSSPSGSHGRRASVPVISARSPIRKNFPRNASLMRNRESRSSMDNPRRIPQKVQNPADAINILARSLAIDMSNVLCYYHYLITQATSVSIEDVVANDLERKWLNPMILSNPTLLSSITLLTISHLRYLKRESHTSESLLNLRGHVLENIQLAIRDSSSMSIADPVVLSIVIMAAYEAFYGTSECYDIHVRGLTQIVELRGGVVEEGFVDRLLLQFDASALLGVRSATKSS